MLKAMPNTERQYIEKLKELIKLLKKSGTLYWIDDIEKLESEIASLESELAKEQESEGVTAEEILLKYDVPKSDWNYHNYHAAMEEYAKSKQINLKKELIGFATYWNETGYTYIRYQEVDEYLQSKEK
jgi:hypothetical protein